jgi:hypothetical protein
MAEAPVHTSVSCAPGFTPEARQQTKAGPEAQALRRARRRSWTVARSHRGVLAEPMLVDTQTDLGCGISGVADRSGRRLGPLRGSGEHRPPRPWPAWTTAGSSAAAGWPARGVGGADYPGPAHARAARWQPSAWKLAHIEAVARLRLYMTDHKPTAQLDQRTRHPPALGRHRGQDGRRRPRLPRWRPGRDRAGAPQQGGPSLPGTIADVDPAWSAGVWWFTPIAQLRLLQQRLSDAGGNGHHQVVMAPEGVAS